MQVLMASKEINRICHIEDTIDKYDALQIQYPTSGSNTCIRVHGERNYM